MTNKLYPTPTPEQLVRARQAAGLTQEQMAHECRVWLRTYQRWEANDGPTMPAAHWRIVLQVCQDRMATNLKPMTTE